jgi:hypothetical protein
VVELVSLRLRFAGAIEDYVELVRRKNEAAFDKLRLT